MIKQIYLAGPYTGKDSQEVMSYCSTAINFASEVVKLGAYPQTSHPLGVFLQRGVGNAQYWYDATLEQMKRCDAVLMLPNWENSQGAIKELEEADKLDMPIFYNVNGLKKWLSNVG